MVYEIEHNELFKLHLRDCNWYDNKPRLVNERIDLKPGKLL